MCEIGHINSIIKKGDFTELVAKILSKAETIITEFNIAGYNLYNGKSVFATNNNIYSYGKVDVISNARLSKISTLRPIFRQYFELIYDEQLELEGVNAIKRLIKAVYGQTGRRKFNCKNNINTTIFFNTNYKFLNDPEYINRCVMLVFEQKNFDSIVAKEFNYLQKYLSFVSLYIIENIQYSEIKGMIKEEEQSQMLSKVQDNRIKRNLAIAITGLKLLIKLIDSDNIKFEQFEKRLNTYIIETINSNENDLSRFITVLKELLDEKRGKLAVNVDYTLMKNGLHLQIGKYAKSFEIQFKLVFTRFFKDIRPLELKQYKKLLLNMGAEMKNVHYSQLSGSRYGLFLPFEKFEH